MGHHLADVKNTPSDQKDQGSHTDSSLGSIKVTATLTLTTGREPEKRVYLPSAVRLSCSPLPVFIFFLFYGT